MRECYHGAKSAGIKPNRFFRLIPMSSRRSKCGQGGTAISPAMQPLLVMADAHWCVEEIAETWGGEQFGTRAIPLRSGLHA